MKKFDNLGPGNISALKQLLIFGAHDAVHC